LTSVTLPKNANAKVRSSFPADVKVITK